MKDFWNKYSTKYLAISPREQYLIFATGLVAVIFSFYSFVIDKNIQQLTSYNKQNISLTANNKSLTRSIAELEMALQKDPNIALQAEIDKYEKKLSEVDQELLTLTSDLINPIQMRQALIELLNLQPGVKLMSFELVGAQPVISPSEQSRNAQKNQDDKTQEIAHQAKVGNEKPPSLSLYRHGIKIKLTGNYFELRNYLVQLEKLSWKFFWQGFHYQVQEYPKSELEIEIYSLSTKREFIGV